MPNLGDYFGQLVNRAFAALRGGQVGATSANALDVAATGLRPVPSQKIVSPVAENYVDPQIERLNRLQSGIEAGLNRYQPNLPIATQSANLARVGSLLPAGFEYLPATLTLRESGGLQDVNAQRLNNPAGVGPGVAYPDLQTAILGGNGRQGLLGTILNNPVYMEALRRGDLAGFLNTYSPPSENAPIEQQVAQPRELLSYFLPSSLSRGQSVGSGEPPVYSSEGGSVGYEGSDTQKAIDSYLSQWDNFVPPLEVQTPNVANIPILKLLLGSQRGLLRG